MIHGFYTLCPEPLEISSYSLNLRLQFLDCKTIIILRYNKYEIIVVGSLNMKRWIGSNFYLFGIIADEVMIDEGKMKVNEPTEMTNNNDINHFWFLRLW